jgi:menaquinone reductase, multiheme cytochrome c subunit
LSFDANFAAMANDRSGSEFQFPKWTNAIRPLATAALLGGAVYTVVLIAYGLSPQTTNVGYAPEQPVPYSHAVHVSELGLECVYCHSTVEVAAQASLPPTQTCMNCHNSVFPDKESLAPVLVSYETGLPIEWLRVHDLPDFVFFNHSAHLTAGVSCVSCHGRVDQMDVVAQIESLSMKWCLDCHRDPDPHLRPRDKVANLAWVPEGDARELGATLRAQNGIQPSTSCSICHR